VLAPPGGVEINFRGCWEGHICGGKSWKEYGCLYFMLTVTRC